MKKLSMLLVALAMFIVGCGGEKQSVSDKLQVAASFYPMAEFARNVGGDKAEVFVLVPDGAELMIGSRLLLIYLVLARHKFSFITV